MVTNIIFGVLFLAMTASCWIFQPDNFTAFVVALFAASYHLSTANRNADGD